MKREERAALLLMHEAAARALRASLDVDVLVEHTEHGVAASWRMPSALLSAAITNDRIEILNWPVFLAWLKARKPDEVVEVLQPRTPNYIGRLRKQWLPLVERDPETGKPTGRVLDDEGTVVPGASFTRGGQYQTSRFKADEGHEAALDLAAAHAVRTGDWMPLWAYAEDADPGAVGALLRERSTG